MSTDECGTGEALHEQSNGKPPHFDPLDAGGLLARGLAMGAADVVPGVSGGTIAFITGIYERFIEALRSLTVAPLISLLRGRPREALHAVRAMHWGVLLPLGFGIVVAIVGFSKFILGMMDSHPGPTYALFFGLIAASAWMPFARMRERRVRHAIAAVAAAVAAFFFVGLRPEGVSLQEVRRDVDAEVAVYAGTIRSPADVLTAVAMVANEQTADGQPLPVVVLDRKGILQAGLPDGVDPARVIVMPSKEALKAWYIGEDATGRAVVVLAEQRANLLWVFVCGMLAISAMVLPGVSGSFLLLFLGQYHAVFGTLHSVIEKLIALLKREPPDPMAAMAGTTLLGDAIFLGAFLIGVVLGLALFARVVALLLHRVHDLTMAALTGLMIGALRVPGEEIMQATDAGGSWVWIIVAGGAGAVVVLGLALVERFMPNENRAEDAV